MLQGVLENGTMAHSGLTILWHAVSTLFMVLQKGIGVIISIRPCSTTQPLRKVRDISRMTSQQKQSNFLETT